MRRRHGGRRSGAPVVIGVVLLLLAGVGAWYWLRSRADEQPMAERPVATGTDTADPDREPIESPLDLPELDESDTFMQETLESLSSHPRWAAWLVPDDLVRRFVTSVVNVAEGGSPRSHLTFLEPEEAVAVREEGERLVLDTASFRRYDLLTEVFTSIDTQAAARLYRQLHPLFEEAHRELGLPDRTFDGSFALAVGNILAVEVPEGPVEVVPDEAVYQYGDPALEGLTPAEKHVVRLGPGNARRVQQKLGQLVTALGITPGDPEASIRR